MAAQVGDAVYMALCDELGDPPGLDLGLLHLWSRAKRLSTAGLMALSGEICRILTPGGLNLFTVRTKQNAHYGTTIHRGEDMDEVGGSIVHFFDRAKVEQVSGGYDLVSIEEFADGGLPRKLFLVTVRKTDS